MASALPPVESDAYKNAAEMSATVRCVLDDRYRKDKHVAEGHDTALHRAKHSPLSAERLLTRMFLWSGSPEEDERLERLRPYLMKVHEAIPVSIRPWEATGEQGRALDQLTDELCRYDLMPDYFATHPEVEEWVRETVRRLERMWDGRTDAPGRETLVVLIGTFFSVRNLLAGTKAWFLEAGESEDRRQVNAVAGALAGIRKNVYMALLDAREEGEAAGDLDDATQRDLARLIDAPIRTHSMPAGAQFGWLHRYVDFLLQDREALKECIDARRNRAALPRLAEAFAPVAAEPPRRDAIVVVPPGPTTLVVLPKGGKPGLTFSLGPAQPAPYLATRLARDPAQPGAEGEVTGLFIDDAGRQFSDFHVDRFVPLPAETDEARILLGAVAAFRGRLTDLWAAAPGLFQAMDGSPLVAVEDGACRFILVRADKGPETAAAFGGALEPALAAPMLDRCGLELPGEWTCVRLPVPRDDQARDEDKDEEAEAVPARRVIRRAAGGKRIPELRWITERLAALGEVELVASKGGSSHDTVTLRRPGKKTTRANASLTLQSTGSIKMDVLWEMLGTLEVTEDEFAACCH